MMEFLINNWYLLVAAIAVITVAAIAIYNFAKKPRAEQLTKIQEWLQKRKKNQVEEQDN